METLKQVLREEIKTDPLGLGYVSLLPDQPGRVADLLNAPSFDVVGKLPIDEFIGTLYAVGVFDALFDAAEAGDTALAKELKRLQVLKGFGIENLDFSLPSVTGRLSATGIPAEVLALLTEKATHKRSRADLLGLGIITALDVQEAA